MGNATTHGTQRAGGGSGAGRHVLVVEDDAAVGQMLTEVLGGGGYRTSLAASGSAAKSIVERDRPDLIVLDLRLPDTDGLILCADLHSRAHVPIIVVSSTAERRDAILALKLGADDFVAKPVDTDCLLARVEAALRRTPPAVRAAPGAPARHGAETPASPGNVQADPRLKRVGSLVMDDARRQVSVGGHVVNLTPTEYRVLQTLIERRDEVVTRDEVALKVWGFRDAAIGHSIDVHIRRLRLKLVGAPVPPPEISVVRGFGYRILAAAGSPTTAPA